MKTTPKTPCEGYSLDSLKALGLVKNSEIIRFLNHKGFKSAEIADFLGIRYQQVRNVIATIPKKASTLKSVEELTVEKPLGIIETLQVMLTEQPAFESAAEKAKKSSEKSYRSALSFEIEAALNETQAKEA